MLSQLRTAVVPPLRPPYPPPSAPSASSLPIPHHHTPVASNKLPPGHPAPSRAILPKSQPHPLSAPPSQPSAPSSFSNSTQPSSFAPSLPQSNLWASVNQNTFLEDSEDSEDTMPGGSSSASTWTDAEKIALLVEILRDCEAAPNWRNITLPQGRNVIEAQHVFSFLISSPPNSPQTAPAQTPSRPAIASSAPRKRSAPTTPIISGQEPFKKKRGRPSKADLLAREQAAAAAAGTSGTTAPPAPQFTPQMYTPDNGAASTTTPAIAPASASATTPAAASIAPVLPVEATLAASLALSPQPKRKRGRPSKADLEERRRREQEVARLAAQLTQSHVTAAANNTQAGGMMNTTTATTSSSSTATDAGVAKMSAASTKADPDAGDDEDDEEDVEMEGAENEDTGKTHPEPETRDSPDEDSDNSPGDD